jgi:hypothetical protein
MLQIEAVLREGLAALTRVQILVIELPTLAIQFGDLPGGQIELVGQQDNKAGAKTSKPGIFRFYVSA